MSHLSWLGETVTIKTLDPPETECSGRVAGDRNRQLRLLVAQPLPVGATIQIDGPGHLVLGEVYRRESSGAEYEVYIRVVHAVPDSSQFRAKGA